MAASAKTIDRPATPDTAALRAQMPRYRWHVEAFHQLAAVGILAEDDRIELVEGELLAMAPIGEEHAGKTKRLIRLFSARVGPSALIDVQNPLVLDGYSEPEPDFMLLRPREDFYETAKPRPADVLLLIEVADTSLSYDREVKIPLYARHGIVETWLLDLPHKKLEIYRQPSAEGYRQILLPGRDERIAPQLLPQVEIAVAALW